MKKKTNISKPMLAVVAFIVIISGLGAYFLLRSPQKPSVQLPNETSTVAMDKNTVVIKDFAFTPANLKINEGESVTWLSAETTAVHSVRSEMLNSKTLRNGDAFQFQFMKKGTYEYTDGIHSEMKGKVVVE